MTDLLDKAFQEAAKLSSLEQNIFAQWVLKELESERNWNLSFSNSEDLLSQMADDALSEHKNKRTSPLNTDEI